MQSIKEPTKFRKMPNSISGKLIQIIKEHPVLYDPTHADYRTKEIVDPLWQQIASQLNEHDMELRKRWRNLRDNYVKLLSVIKKNEHDEVFRAEAVRKYYKWIWTKEMQFFHSYVTIGNNLNDIDLSRRDVESDDNSTIVEKVKPQEKITKKLNTIRAPSRVMKKEQKGKKISMPSTASASKTLHRKSILQKSPPINSNPIELDATDRLFLAHSQNVKLFSARRQAITKLKIAQVIMEQEILDQEEKDAATTSIFSTAKSESKRKFQEIKLQFEDHTMPFETVCGYDTDDDEGELQIETRFKTETFEEDPVEENEEDN